MKRTAFLLLMLLAIVALAWRSYAQRQPRRLALATPEQVGLLWQECAVSGFDYAWRDAERCFGHPMPLWTETDAANFGERVDLENWRLAVDGHTYHTEVSHLVTQSCYTLYRDGVRLHTLCGEFSVHSPNISLQNIGGKVAWEFADGHTDTILYDGQDLRRVYGLDGAYRPYGLEGKLIFVGKKDGQFFLVYDGVRVEPAFDEIAIAYCCEPVLWSVQFGQGRYLFWGERNGQWYVVEVVSPQSSLRTQRG